MNFLLCEVISPHTCATILQTGQNFTTPLAKSYRISWWNQDVFSKTPPNRQPLFVFHLHVASKSRLWVAVARGPPWAPL